MECVAKDYGQVIGILQLPEDFFEQERASACERNDTGVFAIIEREKQAKRDAEFTSAEVVE